MNGYLNNSNSNTKTKPLKYSQFKKIFDGITNLHSNYGNGLEPFIKNKLFQLRPYFYGINNQNNKTKKLLNSIKEIRKNKTKINELNNIYGREKPLQLTRQFTRKLSKKNSGGIKPKKLKPQIKSNSGLKVKKLTKLFEKNSKTAE